MYSWTKNDNKRYLPKGSYLLMEPIEGWYEDRNKGLAIYLDDELEKKVKYIHYQCIHDGYVEFDVELKCDEYEKVTYRGEELTLKDAVCKYIQGQISDGWGENGIYVLKDWMGGKVKCVSLTWDLYERDYEKSKKFAKKNGEEFAPFDWYPAYKKIKL